MKTILIITIILLSVSGLSATKYAGEIFRMGAGVRNFALGRTGITDVNSPALAHWNSSLLLLQNDRAFELMHAREFNGLMRYDTFSGSIGDTHRIGFTVSRIGISNINLTRLPYPDQDPHENNLPYVWATVNNADYIAYIGIARRLGNIPIGFTLKTVYRDWGVAGNAWGFGLDISTHFIATENLKFGFRVRDVIPTQLFYSTGTREFVRTGIDAETQIRTRLPIIELPLIFYLKAEVNFDGIQEYSFAHRESISIDPHLGAEIILHQRVSLFLGQDVEFFTTGVELNYNQFLLNYAFQRNPFLDNSHRFSIGYRF